jgi:SMC interacting uncharacterized protein involved in chromosome segregation|tara:strand:+ start:724 stop:987 length:264 start_codon:yes stop_codon:yes gene_type:complete
MKHIKSIEIFEDAQKVQDLNSKLRDLDKKRSEIKSKASETAQKQREEEDPLKSELHALAGMKLSLQSQIAKIDIKITALKIKQENNK